MILNEERESRLMEEADRESKLINEHIAVEVGDKFVEDFYSGETEVVNV